MSMQLTKAGKQVTFSLKLVNTIEGAVEALSRGGADYFMWEHFMTKPLVDGGVFRRIADCPTPWPCFVIAVRNAVLETHAEMISAILETINKTTTEFKQIRGIAGQLSKTFHQKETDIAEWLSMTEWSQKQLDEDVLNKVQNQLLALSLIDKKGTFAEIVKAS